MRRLLQHERAILKVLADGPGAFLTRDIALWTPQSGGNRRQHSGATRSWLTVLDRDGFVGRLDGGKPTAWLITAAGRAALEEQEGRDG